MYERILVPLDGSTRSEVVFPHVEEIAGAFGSLVLLLRAVSPTPGGLGDAPADTTQYLEQLRARLGQRGIRATVHIVEEPAGSAIVDKAEDEGVSLICMATRGRGGVRRMVLGSVADHVIRQATVPVLLVRSA